MLNRLENNFLHSLWFRLSCARDCQVLDEVMTTWSLGECLFILGYALPYKRGHQVPAHRKSSA